jgi:hypothetical protein
MADSFSLESALTEVNHPRTGTTVFDTGDLRRRYNFGDRVSELNIAQDPFFRMVSKLAKKSTDDPQFKFTERRPSWHKRYGYLKFFSSTVNNPTTLPANTNNIDAAGNTWYARVGTDYANTGNLVNRVGQTTTYEEGDANTQPLFFVPDQLVKFPVTLGSATGALDSIVARITNVDLTSVSNYAVLSLVTVKGVGTAASVAKGIPASVLQAAGATTDSEETLAPFKCYVVGSAHSQGSGYPETWKDQPFSTGYGCTQIWKTAMAMDNTTRATVLKYDASEWARVWREKLIEHKWDIEQSLLFNGAAAYASDPWYTDGIISYISSHGNSFSLPIATKTQDDFLDDMSSFLDPRYNNSNATLFFVGTAVYNWLHKLSGYFSNNLEVSPNFRSDMALTGKKKVFGVDITTISTPYGDMNVARNIHLDGTNIGILACNMRHMSYRPLVGNGLNRDTAIYVGIQTLENSGVDRRVDLIQTEAGLEVQVPEAHAIWVKS